MMGNVVVKCVPEPELSKKINTRFALTNFLFLKNTGELIDSIIKANEKGKIKIKKIEDNTSDKVEINILLNNDVSPDKT
jgi:topoisomerase-4 subunit A